MKVVMVGNGPAAVSAAEAVRARAPSAEITMVARDTEPAYTPCFLANYVRGDIAPARLRMRDDGFYERLGIETLFGLTATGIDPETREVRLDNGTTASYDRLLLAAGSSPLIPNIPGIEGPGVFPFRTLADANRILTSLDATGHAVVMGAGFIGLEIAEALHCRGISVTVVEKENRILPRMLDAETAGIVETHLGDHGLNVLTGESVVAVERDGRDTKPRAVRLEGGRQLPCELLIVSVGVRPNLSMLPDGTFRTAAGVLVDAAMETSVAGVYAAGDMAEIEINGTRATNPIHTNAVRSGLIAGANITGDTQRLTAHIEAMNVVNLFGLRVLSLGDHAGGKARTARRGNNFIRVCEADDGTIRGVQAIGDVRKGGIYLSIMRRGLTSGELPDLLAPGLSFGATLPMPAAALSHSL